MWLAAMSFIVSLDRKCVFWPFRNEYRILRGEPPGFEADTCSHPQKARIIRSLHERQGTEAYPAADKLPAANPSAAGLAVSDPQTTKVPQRGQQRLNAGKAAE